MKAVKGVCVHFTLDGLLFAFQKTRMGVGAPDAIAFGRFLVSGEASGIYLSILVGSGRGGHYDTLPGGSLVVGRICQFFS